jgi:hypothetical protein
MPRKAGVGQKIARRRLVGGAVAAPIAGISAADAFATGQSERLPAFQFLGHYLDDRVQEPLMRDADDPQDDRWGEPNQRDTVGDVPVDLRYGLRNGKLTSLVMVFDSTSHRELREMLIGKYGKVAYECFYKVNTAVRQYDNTVTHWQFREGFLVLTQTFFPPKGMLVFHPYLVMEEDRDPETIRLRMLGKTSF